MAKPTLIQRIKALFRRGKSGGGQTAASTARATAAAKAKAAEKAAAKSTSANRAAAKRGRQAAQRNKRR